MVGHQTVAKEAKRIAVFGFGKRIEEGEAIGIVTEDVGAVVAPVKGVINEPVINRSR